MRKVKVLFIALLAIVSCQIEEDFQQIDNNGVPMTFYAGIELPEDHVETKTILGGSPSDKYRKVLWETDDEVYVTNETYSSRFINTAENGANLAILEGELSQGSKYLAAYPYDIVTDYTSSAFNVNLPVVQEYYEDGINPGTFPMVAKCNNGTFNFQNICGIFVLQLLGEKTVSALTFSGEGETGNLLSVAGNGTVSMGYDDYPTLNLNESSSKTVKLNCSNGVALNIENPTLFHIILPDGIYRNFKVVVEATDGSIMTITSTKPLRIKRSTRTTAAELTYGDVIDLSEEGTANCYIVNNPGNYSIDASVKGNSLESVGQVATAEVLWESFGTTVKPEVGSVVKNVKYVDGKVKFDIPVNYNEGNAVIAVKNTSGTILWSWHVWVTDKPNEYIYPNNAGVMMDRNLGATSAIPGDVGSLGLFYEWGRKDPFLGSSSITTNVPAESTLNWPTAVDNTASTGTIQYSIENPTTFIRANFSLNGDWLNTRNDQVWQTEKTMYDPCPPGWKVPDGGPNGFFKLAGFKDTMFDQTNCGIYFNCDSSLECWFPAAGQHDGDVISGAGTNGLYAGSRYNGGFVYRMSFRLTENETTGSVSAHGVGGRGIGHSVRCVKEVAGHDITKCIDLSANGTANSYIISTSGRYKFNATVKGNSMESVGIPSEADVLWESFGTDVAPLVGEVIKNVVYQDGFIEFQTSDSFNEGNAVIAVKDDSGTILWSWHIWVTDEPQEQVYYHNAGTMMDRNLGATSATPRSVGTLGLLYQWGRKDPFLASYVSNGSATFDVSKSTLNWPESVHSNQSTGTINYAVQNPTTYIKYNAYNFDWYYTGSKDINSLRWEDDKTIYDPCPVGWKVPNGDNNGVWATALGNSSEYKAEYDGEGMNFSGEFGDDSIIWYPSMPTHAYNTGSYNGAYSGCVLWSSSTVKTTNYYNVYCLSFDNSGLITPSSASQYFASGLPVRCIKDTSDSSNTPDDSELIDYVDEYGVNHGKGTKVNGLVWAPVNCGYHATDYKYGKHYQWGRKYGQGYNGSFYDGDWDQTYSDATEPTIYTGPVQFTTGQQKSNSNKFYAAKESPHVWFDTSYYSMWNPGTEDTPEKGEFDPCPTGWRLPTKKELSELTENYSDWSNNSEGLRGIFFSGINPYHKDVPQIFLPAAGLISNEGLATSRAYGGYYWSSLPLSSEYGYMLGFYTSNVNVGYHYTANGYSVRCVQK